MLKAAICWRGTRWKEQWMIWKWAVLSLAAVLVLCVGMEAVWKNEINEILHKTTILYLSLPPAYDAVCSEDTSFKITNWNALSLPSVLCVLSLQSDFLDWKIFIPLEERTLPVMFCQMKQSSAVKGTVLDRNQCKPSTFFYTLSNELCHFVQHSASPNSLEKISTKSKTLEYQWAFVIILHDGLSHYNKRPLIADKKLQILRERERERKREREREKERERQRHTHTHIDR